VLSINGDAGTSIGNFQRYSEATVFQLDSTLKKTIMTSEAEHCLTMARFLGQVEWRRVVEKSIVVLAVSGHALERLPDVALPEQTDSSEG